MYRLVATYAHAEDDDALIRHYRETHAPLAAKLPDVRSFSWGVSETLEGDRPAHALVAVIEWDSKDTAAAALGSEVGEAAVADLANFAQAGVDIEFHEVVDVV